MVVRVWHRRFVLLVLASLCAAAAVPARGEGPAQRQQLAATLGQHVFVAGLAADAADPLHACDPNAPETDFLVANLQTATLPGFSGTIFQGEIINHCTVAASDVAMLALFVGKDGGHLGQTAFQPDFGLIRPGAGSPFVALSPRAPSEIGKVIIAVVRFTPVSVAVPVLELKRGSPTPQGDGLSVPYEVHNSGSATAALPRIAGRLLGTGCDSPFAVDFLAEGSPIPPGGSVSGNLVIPGSCAGAADIEVGSDAPMKAGLPPGLSFADVRALYTPDGVLHVIANVCNNSTQEAFLPQFRAQFSSGTAHLAFNLTGTGIYSGNSCAPLLATVPGAPAGLTFESLVTAAPLTAAQLVASQLRQDPFMDFNWFIWASVLAGCTDEELETIREHPLGAGAGRPQVSEGCEKAFGEAIFGSAFSDQSNSLTAAAVANPPNVLSFAYNNSNAALPSSAFRIQALGYGRDGSLVAGIDVASPPSLPAHGWGISITPVDTGSVIALPGDVFRIGGEGFAIPK